MISLRRGEKVLGHRRSHILSLFWWWIISILVVLAPWFFLFWLVQYETTGYVVFGVTFAIGLLLFTRTYISWKHTVCYVTNQRIVDIDKQGLVQKEISIIPLDSVEDVSGTISGGSGMFLRTGIVRITKNGGKQNIVLKHVRKPAAFAAFIMDVRESYIEGDENGADVEVILDSLSEYSSKELVLIRKKAKRLLDKRRAKQEKAR